jgi:hypothetical protein
MSPERLSAEQRAAQAFKELAVNMGVHGRMDPLEVLWGMGQAWSQGYAFLIPTRALAPLDAFLGSMRQAVLDAWASMPEGDRT